MPMIEISQLKPLCDRVNFARQQFNDACSNFRNREGAKDRDPEGYERALKTLEVTNHKLNIEYMELANASCRLVATAERDTAEG